MIKKLIKSFGWALSGIETAWKGEMNFRVEVFASLLAIILAFILEISRLEFTIVILTIFVVLTVEVFNTAFENVCDKIEPQQDPLIGRIKDLSAGAVLLTSIGALLVGILIFVPHLF